jgi:hypothetical protein
LALLPGTVLCRAYGSLRKSDKAAASYGKKVESRKLKVESGRELKMEKGKLKVENEKLKRDKITAANPLLPPPETKLAKLKRDEVAAVKAVARDANEALRVNVAASTNESRDTNGTTRRGIAKKPVKAERVGKLKGKKKKGNKQVRGNP